MNKTELVAAIAAKEKIEKKAAEAAVKAVTDAITDALAKGDKVQLVGFGTFEVRNRAAKTARNIKKNTTITIDAHDLPGFKPAKSFAEQMKG